MVEISTFWVTIIRIKERIIAYFRMVYSENEAKKASSLNLDHAMSYFCDETLQELISSVMVVYSL